jgi:hypothetical protein
MLNTPFAATPVPPLQTIFKGNEMGLVAMSPVPQFASEKTLFAAVVSVHA